MSTLHSPHKTRRTSMFLSKNIEVHAIIIASCADTQDAPVAAANCTAPSKEYPSNIAVRNAAMLVSPAPVPDTMASHTVYPRQFSPPKYKPRPYQQYE